MPKSLRSRGIMFSTPMVAAILDGTKSVTRRLDMSWLNVKKGRKLYVRETWRVIGWYEGEPLFIEFKDGKYIEERVDGDNYEEWDNRMREQSSEDCERAGLELDDNDLYIFRNGIAPTRWRPSIFMPRGCSRIDLRATEDAREERLQDITEEEAKAEGVKAWHAKHSNIEKFNRPGGSYRNGFHNLWTSLHKKPGERWEDNPRLVRIAFRRICP